MADYYGSVDYGQGYGNYNPASGSAFPPAGGPPPTAGQWNQPAAPPAPAAAPAGYPPAGAPPDAHYPAYPPQQYRQPLPNPAAPPTAPYNGAPAYAQPPPNAYGQPPTGPPAPANGAAYGVPPPIAPPGAAPYGQAAPYGSRPPPAGYPDDVNSRPAFRGPPPGTGRSPGPGFNKGFSDRRGGYGGPNMEEQKDTIFVSGLPDTTTEEQLQEFFGSIGLIKMDKRTNKPKIWIYRDKASGKPKGEVTITYDDPVTATSAISWFNEKDFFGSTIKVELAQRKTSSFESRGFGGSRDGPARGGRGAGPERDNRTQIREGDWRCPNSECNNNNFAWRNECNRCKAPKPAEAGSESRRAPPSFGERRGGHGGRPPYSSGGPGGFGREFRGGFSSRGPPRGGPPYGERSRPGGPRSGPRESGRAGGPMRGSDSRRAAPY